MVARSVATWLGALAAQLNAAGLGRAQYKLRLQPAADGHGGALVIEKQHHGLASTRSIPANLAMPEV